MRDQHGQVKRPPLEKRRAIHNIVANDSFDKTRAEAQIAKVEEQHKTSMLVHMETQSEIYNILTLEQKEQFNANSERRLTECATQRDRIPETAE